MNIKEEAPFFEINVDGLEGNVSDMFKCFTEYIIALQKAVIEELPGIIESGQELPDKAKAAKDSAVDEFKALGFV